MTRVIGFRLLAAIPNLVGIIVIAFIVTRILPGDAAAYYAGPTATAATIEETRQRLGLDGTVVEQFFAYVGQLVRGDLGDSLSSGQPVVEDFARRLPASLELTLFALVIAIAGGILLGVGAALRPRGVVDRIASVVSAIGQAVPTFFLGLILIFVFYYILNWAPEPLGRLSFMYSPPRAITGFWTIDALLQGRFDLFGELVRQLALPVITLAWFGIGPIARVTRSAMLDALSSDFVRTARAAGLRRRTILWRYGFRNALIPVLHTTGMVFSFMLGANVLVEDVFGWPGIGAYTVDAVLVADYAPVQAYILVMAALYIVVNLAIDVVTALVDPRVRYDS